MRPDRVREAALAALQHGHRVAIVAHQVGCQDASEVNAKWTIVSLQMENVDVNRHPVGLN